MPLLGAGHGRIELDQDLAGLDPLPVADMDRALHTGLEGLDQLGAAVRDDLALCRRHDVDAADAGPDARQAESADDDRGGGTHGWRWRRLRYLERRRQQGELVIPAAHLLLREGMTLPPTCICADLR